VLRLKLKFVIEEGVHMLLDVRTYRCKPGTLKAHLALYEKMGKAPQSRHLGAPLAYLTTETGNPNEYIHIWMYESAADREQKRAGMQADADWIAYLAASAELGALEHQDNKLMRPVDFYPQPTRG
jgi:hypothetical protein